jgi:hypothetical protein
MSDTSDLKENKWEQGFHYGTFRKVMKEQYGIEEEFIENIKRIQTEDNKWWDVFYVPLDEDDILPKHLSKVIDVIREGDKCIGLHMIVRNYHYKSPAERKEKAKKERIEERKPRITVPVPKVELIPSPPRKRKVKLTEDDKKIMHAIYYQEHKDKIKAYSRARYQKIKHSPEYIESNRVRAREYWREKHNLKIQNNEQIRRNEIKRTFGGRLVTTPDEQKEIRIAELMILDDARTITDEQLKELEELLS